MISVIVATFNGAPTLERMLSGLMDVKVPTRAWEIIAVDNGSTDRTPEILRAFEGRLPLHYLRHPQRGKNRALNAALGVARGSLLAFTDDDVLVDADWLTVLEQAAAMHAGYDIFGGAITPHWESIPPDWILRQVPIGITYGLTDETLPQGDIFPGLVWGANMMVRRTVFDAGLRFNEAVGPSAGQYVMGSETEFNLRAAAAGHKCRFVPQARVRHIIRSHQLDRRWVLQRAYRFGRNAWNQELLEPPNGMPTLFGVPRWRYRSYIDHYIQSRALHIRQRHDDAFSHDWELNFLGGYFRQARLNPRKAPTE